MASYFIQCSETELRKILRSGSIWPHSPDGYVVLHTEKPENGPFIEFKPSICKDFDNVEISEYWFENHRPQALYLFQEWESEFELPEILASPPKYLSDEAAKNWVLDPSILERVKHSAQLAYFLKRPQTSIIISRDVGECVTLHLEDIERIGINNPMCLGEFVNDYPQYPYEYL